jgi:hypothetical protein
VRVSSLAAGLLVLSTSVQVTPLCSLTIAGECTDCATSESYLTGGRHYIENTSDADDLVWIEIYKSDRVADISLTQWLALTPADIVAQTLKVPIDFVESLKKDKQVLVK